MSQKVRFSTLFRALKMKGFKAFNSAVATLGGIELYNMLRKISLQTSSLSQDFSFPHTS